MQEVNSLYTDSGALRAEYCIVGVWRRRSPVQAFHTIQPSSSLLRSDTRQISRDSVTLCLWSKRLCFLRHLALQYCVVRRLFLDRCSCVWSQMRKISSNVVSQWRRRNDQLSIKCSVTAGRAPPNFHTLTRCCPDGVVDLELDLAQQAAVVG